MVRKKKKAPKAPSGDGIRMICKNRRALRDFDVTDRLEAGVVLTGTEVKSCRAGKANLNDAYVLILDNEAILMGGNIAEYAMGNRFNHEPTRKRKLLLHRREIHRLAVKIQERGLTAVPLAMYFKGGWVKLDIAIGKGRTRTDKRERVREREVDRELQRALRRGRR